MINNDSEFARLLLDKGHGCCGEMSDLSFELIGTEWMGDSSEFHLLRKLFTDDISVLLGLEVVGRDVSGSKREVVKTNAESICETFRYPTELLRGIGFLQKLLPRLGNETCVELDVVSVGGPGSRGL